ncbi:MAG: hypothetical protein A2499_00695 [Stygiobacter sp. RIFOXYC12_FULL_38_8]|nr:MAG: hypothetical protein A2X62_09365 [Stygiobacter sp. GWC2_38_9]OGU80115.1 MAG: hypothetical protein A2279_03115 [Stygiobacter sp. RIFOXYA12_FULL_38_9]OGV06679.1 MAG: hypothetical protein A2299_01685 [Stygiobacter sp. RIFOXYB2_FULL_37_11]OGV11538.1 MAG: hypothetical protein A2237_05660 [Stygiobacter sp. RIFOXYA2_FULL_38_8]OGV15062.1 MAG: hypothetical protein A2440_06845 [Stygiobacter sp. RIFOXYC2_FULL_38_25]OGV29708.1 MAG: hypothetical protein A2499_00695 [Stygiobacter sp. RIFOXYC12_FULL_
MDQGNKLKSHNSNLESLVSVTKDKYDATKYNDHILDQYKLYVEMADRISSRRLTANSFFLSLNSILIAFLSYVNFVGQKKIELNFNWLVALAGLVLCYMWYRVIRSYRDLNTAKFNVIHQIEKMLPISPYDAEWESVGRGKNSKLYLPFSHIELFIPWLFLIIHLFVFISSSLPELLKLIYKT